MILPTKHIAPHLSLIGIGAAILNGLDRPSTVSDAWDHYRTSQDRPVPFSRFVLALDLLYAIEAIVHERGILRKAGS